MTDRAASRRGVALAAALAVLTVAISAAPRLALAAGALPEAARPFIWSDMYATYVDLLGGGRIPYRDTFFDYPPLIGYAAGLFAVVTAGPVAYVLLWAISSALGAAAVALLLTRAGHARDVVVFWSLSPQLLLFGGSNVDAIPAAFVVAAVLLARRGRMSAAFVALAVGAVTKVFPAVVLPALLERVRAARGWPAAAAGAAIFLVVGVLIAGPSLAAPYPSTQGLLHQAGRTNIDSVWGIALGLLEGVRVPGAAQALGAISLAGFVATYALLVLPSARRDADPARAAVFGILALLLWSRLYSPQYSLWVLPFFVLLGMGRRPYALLSLADVLVFASVYPLTLVPWSSGDTVPLLLLGALAAGVVLRHVALILVWRGAQASH